MPVSQAIPWPYGFAIVPARSEVIKFWKCEGDEVERLATACGGLIFTGLSAITRSGLNLWIELQATQISFSGMFSVIDKMRCLVSALHLPHWASISIPA
jgi:hypothetical protein